LFSLKKIKKMNKSNFLEPFQKFEEWFKKACENQQIIEPTAMCLATSDQKKTLSARMILLKKFDERGFCFFTNLTSKKSQQLQQNQNVALCFYWAVLGLQIRIEGAVEKVSSQEADDYFSSRRRESQIGAWASKQSQEMENWQEFEDRIAKVEKKFTNKEVSRPEFWSGFRVVPNLIEFWQEGNFRIHQRQVYERSGDGWKVKKIYP
jgi:pyridoxamine 5'-phosphate oxidase